MSRTIIDVPTSKSESEILKVSKEYLTEHGFEEVDQNNEKVWKRGSGILTGPLFMKVTPQKGKAVIEAWIKFALLPFVFIGEMGIDGFVGGIPKKILKSRAEELQAKLS